ncbi:MAG: OmpA family protein [Alteromonadaceae bacterium]
MNNNIIQNGKTTKLAIVLCTALFIVGCAETRVVVMESSVEQLKNLDDYDRDGVVEAREKCAGTVLGATIDNYGCGRQTPSIEPLNIDIKFANNSYVIPSLAYGQIKELAEFLEKHQELNVVIEGHTSLVGNGNLNQALSENRANAVAFVLVNDFNLPKVRVSSVGYGFERLEEEGDTPEAHAINRRIMAELTHTKHVDDMMWTIYTVDQTL